MLIGVFCTTHDESRPLQQSAESRHEPASVWIVTIDKSTRHPTMHFTFDFTRLLTDTFIIVVMFLSTRCLFFTTAAAGCSTGWWLFSLFFLPQQQARSFVSTILSIQNTRWWEYVRGLTMMENRYYMRDHKVKMYSMYTNVEMCQVKRQRHT